MQRKTPKLFSVFARPLSGRRNPLGAKRGFTLIEILVVMLIVSIVAGAAVLTIGHNRNKQIESFAKDFSQLIVLAQQQAMLQPMVLGVQIGKDKFRFLQWEQLEGQKPVWQVIRDDDILREHLIPDELTVSIRGQQPTLGDGELKPDIVIATNGSMSPFELYVGDQGKKPLYVVIGEADGEVHAKRLD